jgi:ferredoxin, 2Fe-2S
MSLVTFAPSGKELEVAEGTTLLAAILLAEPTFPHKCEGNAQCGSCHI